MGDFVYPGIVSSLALLVYYFTLLRAGLARVRFKIEPPSHSGPPDYERYVRTHLNTLEHLALLLDRQGDVAGAKLVGARALRLKRKEGL